MRALLFTLLLLVGRFGEAAAQLVLDPTGEVRIGSLVRLSAPGFSYRFVQGQVESIGPDFLNVQRRDTIWTIPAAQISLLELGERTNVRERIVFTLIGGLAGYAGGHLLAHMVPFENKQGMPHVAIGVGTGTLLGFLIGQHRWRTIYFDRRQPLRPEEPHMELVPSGFRGFAAAARHAQGGGLLFKRR